VDYIKRRNPSNLKTVSSSAVGRNELASMPDENSYQLNNNKILLSRVSEWYLVEGQSLMSMPILRKYEEILKANLYEYNLPKEYYYRPEYVSNDIYETVDLWYIILFVNNMPTVDHLNKEVIMVPDETIMETINYIINKETNIGTEDNPVDVAKHFLKGLNKPSIDTVPLNMKDKHMKFRDYNNFINSVEKLNGRYMKSTVRATSDYFLNDKFKLYDPFTLGTSKRNKLTSMNSIYYRKGLDFYNEGKIFLSKGQEYGLFPLFSGEMSINITDDNDETVYSNKVFNEIREPVLNIDFRDAYAEQDYFNIYGNINPGVSFDEQSGLFSFESKNDSSKGKIDLIDVKLQDRRTHPARKNNKLDKQYDIGRVLDSDVIVFNLLYKTKFLEDSNGKPLGRFSVDVVLRKNGNNVRIISNILGNNKEVVDTKGTSQYIKFAVENDIVFDEAIISVYVTDISNSGKIEVGIMELDVSVMDRTDMIGPITVDKSDWYYINTHYKYRTIKGKNADRSEDMSEDDKHVDDVFLDNLINSDNRYFTHDDKEGIFYAPMFRSIKRIRSGNTNLYALTKETPPIYTGFYGEKNVTNMINNRKISVKDESQISKIFHSNLKLPDKYIMTVRVKILSKNGGSGFLFDYDKDRNEGYMLWIPGSKRSIIRNEKGNISQPEMLPQGFYELDKTFGEVLHSYPNESENAIYYTNGKELDFTNKYIKIIKDYNRVRVFLSNSRHNFRYTDPDVSIKDIENININGSIGN